MSMRSFYWSKMSSEDRAVINKWHPRMLAFYLSVIALMLAVVFATREQPMNANGDITASIHDRNR
jgi:hypothetical protein